MQLYKPPTTLTFRNAVRGDLLSSKHPHQHSWAAPLLDDDSRLPEDASHLHIPCVMQGHAAFVVRRTSQGHLPISSLSQKVIASRRYENALGKANEASLALQPSAQDMQEEVQDEADDDLYASLARARRAAQLKAETPGQPGPDEVAAQAARRRQAAEEAAANAGRCSLPACQGADDVVQVGKQGVHSWWVGGWVIAHSSTLLSKPVRLGT